MRHTVHQIVIHRQRMDTIPINHMGWIIGTTTHFCDLWHLLSKQIEVFKQTLLVQKNVPISISLEPNQTDIDEVVHVDTRGRILVGLERNVLHQTWLLHQNLLVLPLLIYSPQFAFHL